MKPPAGYPTEPKSPGAMPPHAMRCGWTWQARMTVDGRLPNGFGAQYSHELMPVMPASIGEVGWDGPVESDRARTLEAAIDRVSAQADIAATTIDATSIASIHWLLHSAVIELAAAHAIHGKWRNREGGSFPLSSKDTAASFRANCAAHEGQEVDGWRCPTAAELKAREPDRIAIRTHFRDAAQLVRCAEYWLWRVSLYREALAAWAKVKPPTAGGGFSAKLPTVPPPAPLDLTQEPPPPPPPTGGGVLGVPPQPPELPEGLRTPPGDPGTPDTPDQLGTTPRPKGLRRTQRNRLLGAAAITGGLFTVMLLTR